MNHIIVSILKLNEVHALRQIGDVVLFLHTKVEGLHLAANHIDDEYILHTIAVADLESRGNRVRKNPEVFGNRLGGEAQAKAEKKDRK